MELRDYIRILRAHWVGVVAIVAATLAAAAVFTVMQDEVYQAESSGFVSAGGSTDPALGSVNDQLAQSRAASYVDIAAGRPVAERVSDELGLDASPAALIGRIEVTQPPETVLLKIRAQGASPQDAQDLANAWVEALAEEIQELEDPTDRGGVGTLRVVPYAAAELPTSPVSPDPVRNLAIALAVGLLLGFGYAMVRHTLDRRLRDADSVEEKFDVPVVGTVPVTNILEREAGSRAQLAVDSKEPAQRQAGASEAFRKIRTNLIFMDVDNPPKVMVVTSPRPGDGKSTVAANIAAAIAFSGQPVVLIDADLRRPTIADSFGLVEGVGLTDVLVGSLVPEDALQATAEHPNLQVMAAGRIPPNPSELLGSKTMKEMIRRLSQSVLVILDAPPLLPVTDAAVLSSSADGALIVISAGKTLDSELDEALDHLKAVNARALGVIVNKASRRAGGYGGGYYYGDYYESSKEPTGEAMRAADQLPASPRGRRSAGTRAEQANESSQQQRS